MVFSSGISFVRSPAIFVALSLLEYPASAEVGQFLPSFRVFSAKCFKYSGLVPVPLWPLFPLAPHNVLVYVLESLYVAPYTP
ncbi:hypothetical protein ANAPH1_00806 [Anaplasma phagocytophilum]|nr:hypothetical protein ANAPH1_00806 [Anaplasma phagocytophilum]